MDMCTLLYLKWITGGFPGGSAVKTLPVNAGDTGLIPDAGRSRLLCSNEAHEPQLLSLCSGVQELRLLSPHATTTEPVCPRAHAPQQEKPPQQEARALNQGEVPARHTWRQVCTATKTHRSHK